MKEIGSQDASHRPPSLHHERDLLAAKGNLENLRILDLSITKSNSPLSPLFRFIGNALHGSSLGTWMKLSSTAPTQQSSLPQAFAYDGGEGELSLPSRCGAFLNLL